MNRYEQSLKIDWRTGLPSDRGASTIKAVKRPCAHAILLVSVLRNPAGGNVPTTREGLIREMIAAGEQRPEHAGPLRHALGTQQTKYLRALAVEMMRLQQGELSNDDARRTVTRKSTALVEAGLLNDRADPGVVLDTLRDHHYLIEHTGDNPSFRFQHQLISEWYASEEVRRVALLALSDEQARDELGSRHLGQYGMGRSHSLRGQRPENNGNGIAAISYLILRSVGIDPDFAAA